MYKLIPNIEIHTHYVWQIRVTYKFVVKNKTIVLSLKLYNILCLYLKKKFVNIVFDTCIGSDCI